MEMPTKKTAKKKAAKKPTKKKLFEDPPIIVGGGSSEIIQIRADLSVSTMPPAGGYNRWRVAGINIKYVNVDGTAHSVNPTSNKVKFLESLPSQSTKGTRK
jgi:hypothetical protein